MGGSAATAGSSRCTCVRECTGGVAVSQAPRDDLARDSPQDRSAVKIKYIRALHIAHKKGLYVAPAKDTGIFCQIFCVSRLSTRDKGSSKTPKKGLTKELRGCYVSRAHAEPAFSALRSRARTTRARVQEFAHNTEGLPLFSRGTVRASWSQFLGLTPAPV
jgi:hypothetical protein